MAVGSRAAAWIRKRTMPRSGRRRSASATPASIPAEAAGSADGAPPARSRSAFSSSALRRRPRMNVLVVVYEKLVYHLMWLVESVVVVGRLIFFFVRYGFKF